MRSRERVRVHQLLEQRLHCPAVSEQQVAVEFDLIHGYSYWSVVRCCSSMSSAKHRQAE